MYSTPRLTPQSLGDTLHQAAVNLGITAIPGLSPSATVVLLYLTLWLIPAAVCMTHTARELAGGVAGKYHEGGWVGLTIGLVGVGTRTIAVALYLLAGASVAIWISPEYAERYGFVTGLITECAQAWKAYLPRLPSSLHLVPVAVLGWALVAHLLASITSALLYWPYRAARERRTRAVLSQLEAQQSDTDTRRGTIRYW